MQALRLLAGGLEHPAPDVDDQAALLGERDEIERRDHAALRMLPTHERFDTGDALGLERDERLIVQHELAALERALELGPELELAHDHLVRGRLVNLATTLALVLR